jgi:hypothetical protein
VPNWSISRNYKEIWNSTKISVTPGVHLTRGDSVQKPLTNGPHGWLASQSPWSIGPTLQHLTGCLGNDALQEAVIRNLRPTVRGGRATWSADHVARLAGQTPPGTPISTPPPLPMEFNTPHSTCSSPLVKVLIY